MRTATYLHFPYCERKCPYCDFASVRAEAGSIPHGAYADAIVAELERRAPSLAGRELGSVFFGGGTPSLWACEELGRTLRAVRGAFASEVAELEVTVECNPASIDGRKASALREAGVNRLSIGVQSLDDGALRYLGRLHDREAAIEAVRAAVSSGLRTSADLIFGVPGRSASETCDDAARLVELGIEHLSAYALTIEPGTRFGELHRLGKLETASEDDYAETFGAIEARLARLGFAHYEVSNYARPGAEARHNQSYWRGDPYLGLGAGAVGCLDTSPGVRRRWRNDPRPERYQEAAALRLPEESEEHLGPEEIVREGWLLGLRTEEGVDLRRLEAIAAVDPLARCGSALRRRLERGDLRLDGTRLSVPRDRWLHLDAIVSDLF